jgi:RNA polymerase sigma factor (sigma-70 family)
MTHIVFQHTLIDLQECLLRFAYSLTADKDDAKDLVQDTFLKALTYCDSFVHHDNLKAWAFTILKNTFINNYRRTARFNSFSAKTNEGYFPNVPHTTGADDPHAALTSKELEATIDSLDDTHRIPFQMRHEGFKYREIAETLELNIGTVKSRIFLTRQKLMKQLSQ